MLTSHKKEFFFSHSTLIFAVRWGKLLTYTINKDHQIMMVDPFFMIVYNLRLFLTTVTPTTITPTAVIIWNNSYWILTLLEPYWKLLDHLEPFWTILNCFGQNRTLIDHFTNLTILNGFETLLTIFRRLKKYIFWPFGPFCIICGLWGSTLDHFGPFLTILDNMGWFWTILTIVDHFGLF